MPRSKANTGFSIRFTGGGANLRSVSVRAMSRALDAVQALLSDIQIGGEEVALHLVGVRNASAAYKLEASAAPGVIAGRLTQFGKLIKGDTELLDHVDALKSLEALSSLARRHDCTIEIRRSQQVLAKIQPTSYVEVSEGSIVRGRMSVYGVLERLGGATTFHCAIRVPTQPDHQLWCDLESRELLESLAKHILKGMQFHGTGAWYKRGGRIRHLDIDAFDPPIRGTLVGALRAAHDAGGDGWDSVINVDAEIAEMRAD